MTLVLNFFFSLSIASVHIHSLNNLFQSLGVGDFQISISRLQRACLPAKGPCSLEIPELQAAPGYGGKPLAILSLKKRGISCPWTPNCLPFWIPPGAA